MQVSEQRSNTQLGPPLETVEMGNVDYCEVGECGGIGSRGHGGGSSFWDCEGFAVGSGWRFLVGGR